MTGLLWFQFTVNTKVMTKVIDSFKKIATLRTRVLFLDIHTPAEMSEVTASHPWMLNKMRVPHQQINKVINKCSLRWSTAEHVLECSWFSSDGLVIGITTVSKTTEENKRQHKSHEATSRHLSVSSENYICLYLITEWSIFNRDFMNK